MSDLLGAAERLSHCPNFRLGEKLAVRSGQVPHPHSV